METAHTAVPQTSTEYDYYSYYSDNSTLVFLREEESQHFGGTFSGVLYINIFVLSLAGNGFLLRVLLVREGLRKSTTLFLLQLVVADLLLTLSLPFWAVSFLHEWVFGTPACRLLVLVFFLGFYGYMLFLVAVTVDRYLAVVHAVRLLKVRSRLCVGLGSASLWLLGVAASIPEAVYSEAVEDVGGTQCAGAAQSLTVQLLGYGMQIGLFFLLPLALIIFCYTRIWLTVLRCRSARRHQAVRLIFCTVVGFFVCWTPYNVILLLGALQLQACPSLAGPGATERLAYAYYVCHALAYCHCFLNPALYIFGSARFRSYLPGHHHSDRGRSLTSQSSLYGVQRGSASQQTCV